MKSAQCPSRQSTFHGALACGALVLAVVSSLAGKAVPPEAEPAPSPRTEIAVEVRLAHPVISGDQPQRSYVQVDLLPEARDFPAAVSFSPADGLTGRSESRSSGARLPVNLAVVLDRSATMQGERLRHALLAIDRVLDWLQADDVLAVVVYNSNIQVLQAATRQPDRERLGRLLEQLGAHGHSNLFGGVTQGAAQLRRFSSSDRVSRVLLLSDGKATIGPGTPKALGELGASLRKEGISVSTIGLGLDYNEDLMVELAVQSQGNHHFVEHPQDLVAAFEQELRQLDSIAATDVVLRLDFAPGITPVRSLGLPTEIHGRAATARIGQVLSGQTTTVLMEVLIDPAEVQPGSEVVAVDLTRMETTALAPSPQLVPAATPAPAPAPGATIAAPAAASLPAAIAIGEPAGDIQASAESELADSFADRELESSRVATVPFVAPGTLETETMPSPAVEEETAFLSEAAPPMERRSQKDALLLEDHESRHLAAENLALYHQSTAGGAAPAAPSGEAERRFRGGEAGEGAIMAQAAAAETLPEKPGEPGIPQITLTGEADEVTRNADVSVLALVLEQQARELRERAIELRDGGEIDAAEELLLRNSVELEAFSQSYEIHSLWRQAQQQKAAAESLGSTGEDWDRVRKELRAHNVRVAGPGVIPEAAPEPGVEADQSASESPLPGAGEPLD